MNSFLTNKEIIKVFGNHIGQRVVFNKIMVFAFDGIGTTSMNEDLHVLIGHNDDGSFYTRSIHSCQLMLKPLCAISKDDAVEISTLTDEFEDADSIDTDPKSLVAFGTGLQLLANMNSLSAIVYQRLKEMEYALPLYFGCNHPATGKTAIELEIGMLNPLYDNPE
jgi:hypothetical protein